jgi:trigger factor
MRRHRSGLTLKGFRPGRVPLSIVKKMYGKAIAIDVVDKMIQERFQEEVAAKDAYDIFGSPKMETLEYEPFGDLHAIINFGVRPEFELVDLSSEEVVKVTHEVDDEEVDEEIETHRQQHAELEPHEDPATEEDIVRCNLQRLDFSTETPVVGERQEDVPVSLASSDTLTELKKALLGVSKGDVVKATLPAPEPETVDVGPRKYEITVTNVSRRNLPELDEAFIEHASNGQAKTLDELQEWMKGQLEERWKQAIKEDFESGLTKTVTRLVEFEIPTAAVDTYLDTLLAELKQQANQLPEGFDEEGYREAQRSNAEDAVRWQLIRDKIIADQEISVTAEDLDAEFEEMGRSRELSADVMRKVFEAYNPGGIQQMERHLIDRKVFDHLENSVKVVEKPFEEVYGGEEDNDDSQDG